MKNSRLEHDMLGEREVPADRYYGIQTLRAIENFDITGIPISHYPRLIRSLAYIKKAAALTNSELGLLDHRLADAIARACDELLAGLAALRIFVDTRG
jgi:aspartate ammonia-lyase